MTDRHRFLVGTCSLHDSNEVSVLQYSEDSNHMEAVSLYSHPDQIWAIESSPTDPSLLVTSRQAFNGSKSLTLWKMDKQSTEDIAYGSALYHNEHQELIELDSFNPSQKAAYVGTVRWHKTEDKLLSFDGRILTAWQVSNDKVSSIAATMMTQNESNSFTTANTAAAWDPHSVHSCAVGCGKQLSVLDVRELEGGIRREDAHSGNIRYDCHFTLLLCTYYVNICIYMFSPLIERNMWLNLV
ncbi:hypothetical protein EON65_53900 [archaeon]|nr:MAG: hypothetical protein EON65_53900 [archaeon]